MLHDPSFVRGTKANLETVEKEADTWKEAFGSLYAQRHQKVGPSCKLPAGLVQLHGQFYARRSPTASGQHTSAGARTVSGGQGSVASTQASVRE